MNMKKVFSCILAMLMMFSMCLTTFATEVQDIPEQEWAANSISPWDEPVINPETGEKVVLSFAYNDEGELVPLTREEYINSLDMIPEVNAEQSLMESQEMAEDPDLPDYRYEYRQTSAYQVSGAPQKVSADLSGPGCITHVETVTVSEIFGGNVSANATIKAAIRLGASFSWSWSATRHSSNAYSCFVASGKTGYIQFTPYYNKTIGGLYQIQVSTINPNPPEYYLGQVWGLSPKKTSTGELDGRYDLIETPTGGIIV